MCFAGRWPYSSLESLRKTESSRGKSVDAPIDKGTDSGSPGVGGHGTASFSCLNGSRSLSIVGFERSAGIGWRHLGHPSSTDRVAHLHSHLCPGGGAWTDN